MKYSVSENAFFKFLHVSLESKLSAWFTAEWNVEIHEIIIPSHCNCSWSLLEKKQTGCLEMKVLLLDLIVILNASDDNLPSYFPTWIQFHHHRGMSFALLLHAMVMEMVIIQLQRKLILFHLNLVGKNSQEIWSLQVCSLSSDMITVDTHRQVSGTKRKSGGWRWTNDGVW